MPLGFHVTDLRAGFTAHRLVSVDRSFRYLFSIFLTIWFNDTDPRHGFSACPDFAVHRPSTLDARLRLGLCMC